MSKVFLIISLIKARLCESRENRERDKEQHKNKRISLVKSIL